MTFAELVLRYPVTSLKQKRFGFTKGPPKYVPLLGVPALLIIVAPRSELVLLHTKY